MRRCSKRSWSVWLRLPPSRLGIVRKRSLLSAWRRFDRIDENLNVKKQEVLPLDGDRLLDNQDLCQLLGVTKRTLARYRQKKLIRYYAIRGKVWYRASEIAEFLKKKGKL